jgi:hypothetical protein
MRNPPPKPDRPAHCGGPWRWAGRRVGRLCGGLAAAALVCLLGAGPAAGADDTRAFSAEELKAAFILNFPKYVEWPTNTFAAAGAPIVFGVLGDEPLSAEMEKMSASKQVNGRAVVIRRLAANADLTGCHLLFVSESRAAQAAEVLATLKGRSVLTVGESADFLERGGMINLARKDRKISLEINLAAATAAQLRISSRLLGVATVKNRPD